MSCVTRILSYGICSGAEVFLHTGASQTDINSLCFLAISNLHFKSHKIVSLIDITGSFPMLESFLAKFCKEVFSTYCRMIVVGGGVVKLHM